MFQHHIIQFLLYYLPSGPLWDIKNKTKFQTFSSNGGYLGASWDRKSWGWGQTRKSPSVGDMENIISIPWGTALVGFKISNYIAIMVFFQPPNYFCHCYKYNLLHKRFIFAAVAVYPHVMN